MQVDATDRAESKETRDIHSNARRMRMNSMMEPIRPSYKAPDTLALSIAREMQERLRPAEIILLGSRATGEHRCDSDVDLMAVCPDEAILKETDRTLRRLLEGKYEVPVVNVTTITKEKFVRTTPLAQSWAGQAARHGVTPDGKKLDYQPEREPEPDEIRQDAIFWLALAEIHRESFTILSEVEHLARTHIPAYQAQIALERAFKGLLAAGNDGARFRRDAALMWRHIEITAPITDRRGTQAMEALLAATRVAGGEGCSLTRLSEAFRRGDIIPDPTDAELKALELHLVPAVNSLVAEGLARSGATTEDLRQERDRRRGSMQ